MHCVNCGKEIAENSKFCVGCGAPVNSAPVNNIQQTNQNTPQTPSNPGYQNQGAQNNKVIFILAYLGILFFLPLVSCPEVKEGRFHANQGLVLLIASVAGSIVIAILSAIFLAISWTLAILSSLLYFAWSVVILVMVIVGMLNANKGLQKPLPVIGKIRIIK